jgi:PAS domain S-box-containing protein
VEYTAQSTGENDVENSPAGHSPSQRLRVLVADDNRNDRLLLIHELQRDFSELDVTEIESAEGLARAFRSEPFDLVITDYQLFWTDGLKIVQKAKALWPNAAVVMFTGTGNEEVAVEAMKAGVDDYVLKGPEHFGRLRASVGKAIESRRQERERETAELRYRDLFDTVPVGLFRCLPTGKILDANPALASMLGFEDRGGLLGQNFALFHPKQNDFVRWREELEREGSVAFIETNFKTRGGKMRSVQIHAKALRDTETQQIVYEGSVEDITERKSAEAEREKLISELRETCAKIKTLTGLLPICASCKKIRDKDGTWNLLESYIEHHSDAHFTHSFCPECVRQLYPEVFLDRPKV